MGVRYSPVGRAMRWRFQALRPINMIALGKNQRISPRNPSIIGWAPPKWLKAPLLLACTNVSGHLLIATGLRRPFLVARRRRLQCRAGVCAAVVWICAGASRDERRYSEQQCEYDPLARSMSSASLACASFAGLSVVGVELARSTPIVKHGEVAVAPF